MNGPQPERKLLLLWADLTMFEAGFAHGEARILGKSADEAERLMRKGEMKLALANYLYELADAAASERMATPTGPPATNHHGKN